MSHRGCFLLAAKVVITFQLAITISLKTIGFYPSLNLRSSFAQPSLILRSSFAHRLLGGIDVLFFPTLKKGIIQLFIVSLHKVPEFWCFFSNTKLLIFGNFYFIIGKSLNSFKEKKLTSEFKHYLRK